MAVIYKKTWPGWFDDVQAGKKKFELRLNDFVIKEGDTLVLQEWNPQTKEYTGRQVEKISTDVRQFKIGELFWPLEEIQDKGLQVISFD